MLSRLFARPQTLLLGSFAAAIATGSFLLWLPVSQTQNSVGYLDALFTSTSAVCVTGLVVVNTATEYSRFGQVVIMTLIQVGGLGVMTFAAVFFYIFNRRLSMRSRGVLRDTLFHKEAAGEFRHAFLQAVISAAAVELTGVAPLFLQLRKMQGGSEALFCALFHSVSAFCNAGFSVYSENLAVFSRRPFVLLTIAGLIILGGIGHHVLREAARRAWRRLRKQAQSSVRWSLSARAALWATFYLIFGGMAGLMIFGVASDPQEGWGGRALHAFFQSVSARTAGFNSVNVGQIPLASILILIGLMFVGGSPGSCAGGVKTTSLAIGWGYLRSSFRGRREVALLGRAIPEDLLHRTALLVILALLWNGAGLLILAACQQGVGDWDLADMAFEQISAFGTVGLSTGLTPFLTPLGKVWIILTMYFGRLGPLTLALWALESPGPSVRHPEERLMIG